MKVFFAIPSFDGKVVSDFSNSMFRTAELLQDTGIASEILFVGGNAYVDLARDILIHQAMKSDATHVMQLDADIGWDAEDILRLLDHDKDVVAGIYPVKQETPKFMVAFNGKRDRGLIGANAVPGGFLLMKSYVLQGMALTHSDLVVEGLPEFPDEKVSTLHIPDRHDGRYWGEDMAFSRRIREAGYNIWVDPRVNLRHWAGTKCYDHKLIGTYLRESSKVSGSAE